MPDSTSFAFFRTAGLSVVPWLIYLANGVLAVTFFVAIIEIIRQGSDAFSSFRRLCGALLPCAMAFFVVATGTFNRSFLYSILDLWQPLLVALGVASGVVLVELWRYIYPTDDDLTLVVVNIVLSCLFLASLAFLLYPPHVLTVWLILPIYVGIVGTIAIRGLPRNPSD